MPDNLTLSKIKLNGTEYEIKDKEARDNFDNYYTIEEVDELTNNMIEITWADLVDLRDNNELKPGYFYRIIDYNFITSKINVHSGNHQFDIIVLALSESMLSETAWAARHAGDTYFQRYITSDGIEWLYTVYADDYAESYGENVIDHADDIHASDVFCDSGYMQHPETGNTVPVLYKTNTDEYDFDDPDYEDIYFYEGVYEFDGDDYDMWSKWESDGSPENLVFFNSYALTPVVVENGELTVSPIPEEKAVSVNINAWELKCCLDNDKTLFNWADTNGKGVIYYMKDEFGNEAPYDFKNAMFERRKITSVNNSSLLSSLINKYLGESSYYNISCNANDKKYFYTFALRGNSNDLSESDGSLFGENAYNIIKPYIFEGCKMINNIICSGSSNIFNRDCFDITLIGLNNKFDDNCYSNLFIAFSTNQMGSKVRNCTMVQGSGNIFGENNNQNISYGLSDSAIGDNCSNNTLGYGVMGLKMGFGCLNNSIGNYCYSLTIGDSVMASQFGGNYCSYNIIGSFNNNIRITCNNMRYSTIESNCKNITINTANSSQYIQYVKICTGITNLTIQPIRNTSYEQIWYKSGRVENAI